MNIEILNYLRKKELNLILKDIPTIEYYCKKRNDKDYLKKCLNSINEALKHNKINHIEKFAQTRIYIKYLLKL